MMEKQPHSTTTLKRKDKVESKKRASKTKRRKLNDEGEEGEVDDKGLFEGIKFVISST